MQEMQLDPNSKYFSQDLFDSALPFNIDVDELSEENNVMDVPIFRTGKFKHYWYGDLDFTLSYLQEIVNNYERKVNPQEVSLNADHMAFRGAYGWLVDDDKPALYIKPLTFNTPEGKVTEYYLFARFALTPKGIKAVKEKEYRYFSAEIADDFSTPEMKKNSSGDSTRVFYGKCLTGCALTNRPFIPNLPGTFSNGSKPDMNSQEMAVSQDDSTRSWLYFVADKPGQQNNGGETMLKEFQEKLAAATDMDAKVKICKEYSNVDGCGDFAQMMLSTLDQVRAKDMALAQAVQLSESMERERDAALANTAALELSLKQAKQRSFSERIEKYESKWTGEGHFPSVVNKAVEFCREIGADKREHLFNDGQEGGFDLLAFTDAILSEIPEDGRVDFSDKIDPNAGAGDGTENNTPAPITPPAEKAQNEFNDKQEEDNGNEEVSLFSKFKKLNGRANPYITEERFNTLLEEGKINEETGDWK